MCDKCLCACVCFCVCRMDSFFLAEMFKYLYLLFTDKSQLPIDIDDYIFTTEAHLLPVSLSITQPPCQSNNTVRALTFSQTQVQTLYMPANLSAFGEIRRFEIKIGRPRE